MRRAAFVAMVLALFGLGCDSADQNPFIVRVSDINNGGTTLLADVLAIDPQTGGATIPTELVPVVLTNRRYSLDVRPDPGTAWYDFQVKRYIVHWRWAGAPIAGVDLTQFDHTEETSLLVPFDGEATLFALLVPIAMKTTAPFSDLATSGNVITLVADIDLVGAAAISIDDEIHLNASLSVSFANFADQ